MSTLKDRLLNILDAAAKHDKPFLRVWDLTREVPEEAVWLERHIDQLLADRTLVEKDIGGDRHVGLRREVDRLEKQMLELQRSPRALVESMLYGAAIKAHPNWRRAEDVLGGQRWTCIDPSKPMSTAAMIEWFEINHSAEAKRIQAAALGKVTDAKSWLERFRTDHWLS